MINDIQKRKKIRKKSILLIIFEDLFMILKTEIMINGIIKIYPEITISNRIPIKKARKILLIFPVILPAFSISVKNKINLKQKKADNESR
jgi:hypothetical protein